MADPDGFHLRIIAEVASLYMGQTGEYSIISPLVAAFREAGLMDVDFALFWDFAR